MIKKLKEKVFLEDDIILGSLLSVLVFFCGIVYNNIFILGVNYKNKEYF